MMRPRHGYTHCTEDITSLANIGNKSTCLRITHEDIIQDPESRGGASISAICTRKANNERIYNA
jgi:hypothetical protein